MSSSGPGLVLGISKPGFGFGFAKHKSSLSKEIIKRCCRQDKYTEHTEDFLINRV